MQRFSSCSYSARKAFQRRLLVAHGPPSRIHLHEENAIAHSSRAPIEEAHASTVFMDFMRRR